jgi:hypothetical protein
MAAQQSHTFASRHTSQSLQKSVPAPTQKEFKNIFPSLLKKSKTLHTQPNDKQMTVAMQTPRPLTVKRFNYSVDRRPACNSTYPKGGVSCSKDSFVVKQTLVFQIKFCGKSPALRVAAKRQFVRKPSLVFSQTDVIGNARTVRL